MDQDNRGAIEKQLLELKARLELLEAQALNRAAHEEDAAAQPPLGLRWELRELAVRVGRLELALSMIGQGQDRGTPTLPHPQPATPPPPEILNLQPLPPISRSAKVVEGVAASALLQRLSNAKKIAIAAAREEAVVQPLPDLPFIAEAQPTPPHVSHAEPVEHVPPADTFAPQPTEPPTRPTRPARPTSEPPQPFGLERLIGGKWFAWIGALAVVIGMALLFKLGYEEHWFRLPPAWRCMGGAAFGLALIAIGELVRKKINAAGAAGLLAAGVGTIYASAFAAYQLFNLVSGPIALILLALTAALGIAVGARANLISVTIVSLVGGYLTPLLIPDPGNIVVRPAFMVMLLIVGLVLSGWRRGRFTILRHIVWWATMILGGGWVLDEGFSHVTLTTSFIAVVWAAVHAELVFVARRNALIETENGTPLSTWRAWHPILSSFSTTAWGVLLAAMVLADASLGSWMAPGIAFVLTAALSIFLTSGLRALREFPRTDTQRLGASLATQAAGLIVVTIILALSDWPEMVAWLTLALSAAVAGKWLRARALDVYALCVLALATARLILYESWFTGMTGDAQPLLGFMPSTWTYIMLLAGAVWVAVGFLLRHKAEGFWRSLSHAAIGTGLIVAGASLVNHRSEVWTYAAIAATFGVLASITARALKSAGLAALSGILLILSLPLVFLTRWWSTVTPAGIDILGLHLEPVAAVVPFVGLSAMLGLWLNQRSDGNWKHSRDAAIAAVVTLFGAALMHTDSYIVPIAFVMLTGAFILTAAAGVRRSLGLLLYAALILAAGTILTVSTEWWRRPELFTIGGLIFSRATFAAISAAAVWCFAGVMSLRTAHEDRHLAATFGVWTGLCLLMASLFHEGMELGSLCLAWIAISTAAGAARRLSPRLHLDAFPLVGLALSIILWTPAYAMDWSETSAPYALHPGLGVAGLLAAAMIITGRWFRETPGRREGTKKTQRIATSLVICALAFISTSLEASRIAAGVAHDPTVRAAAVSIWWGILSILLIAAGFIRRIEAVRWAGLLLLGAAMFKAVFMDLRGVPQLWRIASFIGLGLMMLAVPVVYSKMSHLLKPREPAPA